MIPDPEDVPVLSVSEAARLVSTGGQHVSRSKAYELVASGSWPSLRWGRSIVIPTAQLRKLLGLDDPHRH